jgi:hypothetical protein
MCCVGAVYSDRMDPKSVRSLMELVRGAVLRSSHIYKMAQNQRQVLDPNRHCPADIEELEALSLLHSLFLWHGSQKQRQQGREEFFIFANITRRTGLMHPFPRTNPGFSSLHQPGSFTGDEVDSWNWTLWIENEKRARVMAYIFLIDAASTIFFNAQPQFDVNEIKVSLPADDAAWEARTEEECASALGLRGEAAQIANISGSRRAKQLGMSEALQVLYRGSHGQLPERATNAFGKFGKTTDLHAMQVRANPSQFSSMRFTFKYSTFNVSFLDAYLQVVPAHLMGLLHHRTVSVNKYNSYYDQQSKHSSCGRHAGTLILLFSTLRHSLDLASVETVSIITS